MSAGSTKKLAAYWDWSAGAEVPDARIVVLPSKGATSLLAHGLMVAAMDRGAQFFVSIDSGLSYAPPIHRALYVTRQADLARLPDLLAVRANRLALVVSPEEAIDLHAPIDGMPSPRRVLDVVFIVGLDEPMAPTWVRAIVEQCRKAGVPVVFLGWGEWVPREAQTDAAKAFVAWRRDYNAGPQIRGGTRLGTDFYRVGVERSGALLDGVAVEDVPTWLDGGA